MNGYLVKIPEHLLLAVKTGTAVVNGVRVIDKATGRTLSHLQQTGALASLLASGNPVGVGAAVVSAASDLAQNNQLQQIKGLLKTLQIVSGVGAAAAVLNLGVSAVGFKIVCDKLNILNVKLDTVSQQITEVQNVLDKVQRSRLITALQRSEDAF